MQEQNSLPIQPKTATQKQDISRKSRQDRKNFSQLKKRNQAAQDGQINESAKNNIDYRKLKLQNRQIVIGSAASNKTNEMQKGTAVPKEFIDLGSFRQKNHYAQGLQKNRDDKLSRNERLDNAGNPGGRPFSKNPTEEAAYKSSSRKPRLGTDKSNENFRTAQKGPDLSLDFNNVFQSTDAGLKDVMNKTPTNDSLLTNALHARVKSNNELKMYMNKYFPQSTRVQKEIKFDSHTKSKNQDLQMNQQNGSNKFNQYFLNKLAKSQSIALGDDQDIGDGLQATQDDPLLRSPSQNSDQEQDMVQVQKENQLMLNKSKSLSKVLAAGQTSFLASTHRLQQKADKTMLNSTASFNNLHHIASTKSFMNKSVARAQGSSYQSQLKGTRDRSFRDGLDNNDRKYSYLHNRPSVNRVKGNNQNASVNSRFFNPRAANNLSKNMSINENFDMEHDDTPQINNINKRYQKPPAIETDPTGVIGDVIYEQKSLHGSSYEQVSMGSIGDGDKGELNIDQLLKDEDNKDLDKFNGKNHRFNKTQYLTQNAQKRDHPKSFKQTVNAPTYNIAYDKIMLNKYQSIVSPKLSQSPQKTKDNSSKTFIVPNKVSQPSFNKSQSLLLSGNLHTINAVRSSGKQVPLEKQGSSTTNVNPRKSNPTSKLSQNKKVPSKVQPTQKAPSSYLASKNVKNDRTSKNYRQPPYKSIHHQTIDQKDIGLSSQQKASISLMKSPRTPKIDITLKKPFINVGTLKEMATDSSKTKKQSEVVPYYSRVKAAIKNIEPIKEDPKTDGNLRQDQSQKNKRQSMVHVQSQALLKQNNLIKSAREGSQNYGALKATTKAAFGSTQYDARMASDAKTSTRKTMTKSNTRGTNQVQTNNFMSKKDQQPEEQVNASAKTANKNELSGAKPKSFLMTSRNTITESLYTKGHTSVDKTKNPAQTAFSSKPSAAIPNPESQQPLAGEATGKKHSVQVSVSQSIKKLDLSKLNPGAVDQGATGEAGPMLSSQRKIGQAKKSMALKKSTSSNKIDLMSKDTLAISGKQDSASAARPKQPFPHKKHSLSQPATLMNYMTAPQNKSTKKALDDTSKAAGVSANKVAPAKSSANPQGPASQLSGMKLQSKSVLTNGSPKAQDQVQEIILSADQLKYPISSADAKRHLSEHLNDYEMQEVDAYNNKIWYVGQNCRCKIKGHVIKMTAPGSTATNSNTRAQSNSRKYKSAQQEGLVPSERQIERLKQMNIFNYGYDDDQGDYNAVTKDHIAYRYEVLESLGSGSFGQAVKCLDHATQEHVAIKVIRNKKKFQYQAGMELKIVKYLNQHDPHDQNNVIRVKDYVVFREHLIISFELLSINMYEFIKNNNFQGVSQNLIRRFAIQILQALKYQQDHNLVHCDLKPENILLKQTNKSGIKLIDYGSSCFMGQRIYTYIQSRFYRAPEIILGIPYSTAIDMWSFGAIIAELYTGFPLFPGESENEQLAYIMELFGVPKPDLLRLAQRGKLFYDSNNKPILEANSRGKIRQPNAKRLKDILKCGDDTNFIDFLNKCFEWHPVERMTPLQALQHPWILEGLPEKVLKHHKKMFALEDKREVIRKITQTDIQGFPRSKKDLTIHQIVDQIRKEDEVFLKKEQIKRQQKEELKKREAARSQIVQTNQSPEKLQGRESSQQNQSQTSGASSPNKERKSRRQRNDKSEQQSTDQVGPSVQNESQLSPNSPHELTETEETNQKKKVIENEIDEVQELQNEQDEDSEENVEEQYLEPDADKQEQDQE